MSESRDTKLKRDGDATFDGSMHSYSSAGEYAECCRHWYNAVYYMQITQLMTSMNSTRTVTQSSTPESLPVQQRSGDGVELRPASFTKRVAAESIDFIGSFVLKLIIVYILVDFEFIDLDRYDRLMNYDGDLPGLIDVTQELFPLEFLTKFIVALFEALYIYRGFAVIAPGMTPGKHIMRIKVVSVRQVTALNRTGVLEGTLVSVNGYSPRLGFLQSLARSLIKNFTMSFLFPLCMIQFSFPFNRGFYEIATNTMVVEL